MSARRSRRFTPLVTADQMRALDRLATERYGIPSLLLMENAGRAVFQAALDMLETARSKRILVVCGPGNNGGDGFVAARHLHNAGADVRIAYFADRARAKGDALTNIEIAEKMGLQIDSSGSPRRLRTALASADLVIDALLGTGVKGELSPQLAQVVGCINLHRSGPVLAVDIPSGVDADTGRTWGADFDAGRAAEEAVDADVTVTFGLPKIGLLTHPGASYVGELRVADIGIPREALAACDSRTFILDSRAILWPFFRAADSHKGDFGHLAVIAGSVGLTGAAALTAQAALRMGTGLVTLAVPESLNDIMEAKLTEAMTVPVPQGKARAFGMASLKSVLDLIGRCDAAAIGPGFGRDDDTVAFTLELLRRIERTAIVDADALYAVSTDPAVLKKCRAPLVITPHPGEMARLLGTDVQEVQSNRLEVTRSFAREHGVTVVLKGAGTVVAAHEGDAWINTSGTPGMASGGVGDVLSGMIGGLLAQSEVLPPIHAACTAVYLHGRAGEIAADRLGEAAMIASDVIDCLGDAIREDDERE